MQGNKASSAAMVENDHTSWYFKVAVGERVDSKIIPIKVFSRRDRKSYFNVNFTPSCLTFCHDYYMYLKQIYRL